MRKIFSVFIIAILTFSAPLLFSLSLAVIPVEPLGVDKNVATVVTELVKEDISSTGMFELVEREKLDAVLKEQELQLSDITEKNNAVKVGNLLNVKKILIGTIGLYSSSYLKYFLSLRLVDVERGTVDAVANEGIRSKDDLESGVKKAVEKLVSHMSFTGEVERVKGNILYTSFGSMMGAKSGMNLAVYRVIPIKDKSGKVFMNDKIPVANVVVEAVTKTGSRCRVVNSSGKLEPGLLVEKGKVELKGRLSRESSITVKSIPENAKVFLNSQFLGVTPLEVNNLKPGVYKIEIRASGYKVYSGKLTLKGGRHLVIERELEPVLEIEDMLLLGRVPKRKRDPLRAATLALIPGLGEGYVGYDVTGVGIPFAIFADVSLAVIYNGSRIERSKNAAESEDESSRLINERLSADYTRDLIFYSALGGLTYLYSILDSALQAGSDFLYPTPVEVSFGVAGGYTSQSEKGENAILEPMESIYYLAYVSFVLRTRPLYFSLGLQYSGEPLWIALSTVLRYPVVDGLFFGVGAGMYTNVGSGGSNVEISNLSKLKPIPAEWIFPQLAISYEGTRVEADIFLSPFTYGKGWLFYLPLNYSDSSWTESSFVGGLSGYMARINFSYFINLRLGVNAGFLYVYLGNVDEELVEKDIARIDKLQYLNGYVGLIFRF